MGMAGSRLALAGHAALLLLCAAVVVRGEDRVADHIAQGAEALRLGHFEAALAQFDAASAAEPSGGKAAFFQAVALNRLKRHREALTRLEQAEALHFEHPDTAFETGWALLGTKQYTLAVEQFEWFDRVHPGRGQTAEFLGRAHFHLGEFDQAETLLHEALRRDADLEPTVRVYLALVEQRRGDTDHAARQLEQVARAWAHSPVGAVLSRYGQTGSPPADRGEPTVGVPPASDKPWRVTVSSGAGYNSNVLAIADGFALPADISNQSSAFGRFTFSAAYDLLHIEHDRLTAGYSFGANVHEDALEESDLLDHHVYARYQRRLSEVSTMSLRVGDQFSMIGGNRFRNRVAVRPAVSRRLLSWLAGEAAYTFAVSEYFFDTAAVSDRDGDAHRLSLTGYWRLPETELSGRLGYFYNVNNTDGSDFDFESHGLTIAARHPLPWDTTLDVAYTHTFEDYDNRNSFTVPTAFSKRRSDDRDALTVQLLHDFDLGVGRRARAYLRYDMTYNDSNVRFFNYDQHVTSAGIIIDF